MTVPGARAYLEAAHAPRSFRAARAAAPLMATVDFLAATLIIGVGALLQGVIGFGMGLLAAPLLVLVDRELVPGPLLAASVLLTLLMARRERHAVRGADLGWSLAGRTIGIAIAVAILARVSGPGMDLLLGAMVMAAVVLSALHPALGPRRTTLTAAGLLSGIMGTTVSVGGPPMAILYQRESGPRIRATLSAYFLIGGVMSLIGLAVGTRFGPAEIRSALLLTPGTLAGYHLSHRLLGRVDGRALRPAVLGISAASAAIVIVRAFV